MKKLKRWSLVLAAGLLSGCFQVEDELTIQPDGSGTVKLVTRAAVPEEMSGMMGMSSRFGGGGGVMYPPTSEAEARQFFPAKSFTVKVEEKKADDGKTVIIEAAFKDINAMLASPYARAHQLALKIENGALTLKALNGGESVARAAELKPEGEMADFAMPGAEDLQKKKGEMKFKFRVTLPNATTDANGAREGKSVTWDIERAKCKDGEEFAAKLAGLLEARCAAEGLKFAPETPARLGLVPFRDLTAGASATKVSLPDTNKIVAAARFVPYTLQVTRSLDLSGEGSSHENQAQLTGAVIIPPELAPQQWGEAKLLEAVDAKGKNLKPAEDDGSSSGFMHRSMTFGDFAGEDEDPEGETPNKDGDQRRMVTLSFKPPDWKVKEIARVKGSLALQYLGASEVLKLSNAVPAGLIMDMSKPSSFSSFGSDSGRGLITDARLTELGLSLRVQMAMVQSGMTMLTLETGGGKSSLVDAQVFDADGRPWPTTLQGNESGGGEEKTCQVMVAGKPKAPLSLGLVISGIGATVEVPILVEKVPVGGK